MLDIWYYYCVFVLLENWSMKQKGFILDTGAQCRLFNAITATTTVNQTRVFYFARKKAFSLKLPII